MKSKINFTNHYSKQHVNFLDMTVRLQNDKITTEVFSKPIDTHTYLHATSFHPPSTILSLPKTQFIRIRRICTDITDFKKHAQHFIDFFISRGYRHSNLTKIATEIEKTDRDSLLTPQTKPRTADHPSRVVFSTTWHPRLRFLQRFLNRSHSQLSTEHPQLKSTFPEPPIVAFRKNKTIRDSLVRARIGTESPPSPKQHTTQQGLSTKLHGSMSSSSTLTNAQSNISVIVKPGSAIEKNVIYAAECNKCNLLYIGQTSQQLNERFNGHRSDILNHPTRCELPQHFHDNACSFDNDLQVYILQRNVNGSRLTREAQEDRWIMRLNTLAPNGMNAKCSDYGTIYKIIFK